MRCTLTTVISLIWLASAGQALQGKYIIDHRKGCKVWTEYDAPSISVSWSGACKNNYAEGPGTLVWLDNGKETARYAGNLQKGYAHGSGKYVWSNGYTLEGNYFEGQFLNLDSIYLQQVRKNVLPMTDSTDMYINDGASRSLFYYVLVPKFEIKGALLLLSGSSENASNVFTNNVKLTQLASDNGLLVIVPSINNNLILGRNELDLLNATVEDVLKKYKVPGDKVVIGGFSLGGLYALRFAEMANDSGFAVAIRPRAVFAADPPVDLARVYDIFQREISRNVSASAVAECRRYIKKMENDFGGDPGKHPEKYSLHSAFARSVKDGGNVKFLQTTPVRIYSDPDIDWQMEKRKGDYFDMGAIDQTTMINQLKKTGNTKAEFINALGKGYNLDGTRNPHSWSIIDAPDCISWILRCLGE